MAATRKLQGKKERSPMRIMLRCLWVWKKREKKIASEHNKKIKGDCILSVYSNT